MKLAFIDVETARLTPGPATIWELALILRDEPGSAASDAEYVWHIRPDLSTAEPGALKVGGYYERCRAKALETGGGKLVHDSEEPADALVCGGPEIARAVAGSLDGVVLVGANVGSFDVPHLDAWLRTHGECLTADYHYLDIGSLVLGWKCAAGRIDGPLKMDAALRACGLDPADYEAHTALGDARAVRDCWDVVMGEAP